MPDGYDTEVGERGGHLSAGERQLIAFARAAIADPRILILDEATSNVDVSTEARIEQGLRRLLAGRTAIVIAHRLSTIRQAGRIVVLDGGEIVEQGTHDELLEADGALRAALPRLGRAGRVPDELCVAPLTVRTASIAGRFVESAVCVWKKLRAAGTRTPRLSQFERPASAIRRPRSDRGRG